MIRCALLALAIAAAAAAQTSRVDLVLLLEDNPGMRHETQSTRLPLKPGDQAAVVGFNTKVKVRQKFTGEAKKLDRAIRRLGGSGIEAGSTITSRPQAGVHLYAAILDACDLFRALPMDPARKRAIVLLFGAENIGPGPGVEDARKALERAHATLFAVAVRKFDPRRHHDPRLRTPPTIPGRGGEPGLQPLPGADIPAITELAQRSGGEMIVGRWNLPEVLARIRR